MTTLTNNNYDAGFLNVPGFGQSVTNPLSAVFYDSLGVVNDLSVYNSLYTTRKIHAGESFVVGSSEVSQEFANIGVPTNFQQDVTLEKDITVANLMTVGKLVVSGREYQATRIRAENGTFTVLAAV